jgi:hypothetical protein
VIILLECRRWKQLKEVSQRRSLVKVKLSNFQSLTVSEYLPCPFPLSLQPGAEFILCFSDDEHFFLLVFFLLQLLDFHATPATS